MIEDSASGDLRGPAPLPCRAGGTEAENDHLEVIAKIRQQNQGRGNVSHRDIDWLCDELERFVTSFANLRTQALTLISADEHDGGYSTR